MKRWKWLWILPVLAVLAVGLGCQSEKPTAQVEEGQLESELELVPATKSLCQPGKGDLKITPGPTVCTYMIARDEAEPVLESKAPCGCFMMEGTPVVIIHDMLCPTSNAEVERLFSIEAELELLRLSEKKRPETWEEFLAQHSDRDKPFVEKYLRERWDDPPACELTEN